MKSKIYYIALIVIFSCIQSRIYAQLERVEKYEIDDFLGQKTFKSATQSPDLKIFFNSSKGIFTYDGHEFEKLNIQNNDSGINQIYYFENSLFIANDNALIQNYLSTDSSSIIAPINVKQFAEFNNELWMITNSELYVWESNLLKKVYQSENGEQFNCLLVSNGKTLLGHSKGLTLFKNGKKIKTFTYDLTNPSKFMEVDSSIYILNNDGIYVYNDDKVKRSFKNDSDLLDFHIDDFGKTWFIEETGNVKVYDLINSEIQYVDEDQPIEGKSFFSDKEGNLWVLGINKLFKMVQKNPFSKVPEEGVIKVFSGSKNNLIVKENEIIIYNDIAGTERVQLQTSINSKEEIHAFFDDDRWIIYYGKSIYTLNKNEVGLNLISTESQYVPLKKVGENQYFAKNLEGNFFLLDEEFMPTQKLGNIDASEKVVFADQHTFLFSKENSVTVLDSSLKVTSKIYLEDTINLENVVPATKGLWYYTSHKIFKINDNGEPRLVSFDLSSRLEEVFVVNVFDDMDGNLWVSSKNMLLRIPLTENNNTVSFQKPIKYTTEDFLYSSFFKEATKDNNGLIWFINENGLSIYNPLKEIPNLIPPGVEINKSFAYQLDDFNNPTDTVFLNEISKTISSNSIVVIEARVINHFDNSKSNIGYKNLSINQSERIIDANERIILTDLSDGLNTIAINGYNNSGIESINEEKVNIYVTPPIWKQNWFYFSSAISLLLLGFVGYRTVISLKNSRARELEEELNKGLEDLEKRSHLQVLKAERLKQLNDLITSQKGELEKKNKQIESQKYELSLTNQQIKKQKDLLQETSSKLTSSINYAQRIQNALMSTEVEIKKAFTDSFVYFLPRDMVSGDFFWFNKVENDKGQELLILAAVDCTGHGVPGAIVSVVGMNLLNNITKLKKVYDPGQILTEMNQDIISDLRQDETQVNDGMDMTIVTYNATTKQLYFAGAKNPLMYIEDDELIRIKGDKHAIGGQQRGDDRVFTTHNLDLSDGKERTFYIFSDGYQDQFGGEKGFKYLVGNFKKLLLSIHKKDVLEQKTILHEEIEDWKDGYAQTDDILVIGFKL